MNIDYALILSNKNHCEYFAYTLGLAVELVRVEDRTSKNSSRRRLAVDRSTMGGLSRWTKLSIIFFERSFSPILRQKYAT